MTRYSFNIPKAIYVNHEKDIASFFRNLHNLTWNIDLTHDTIAQLNVFSSSDQIVIQCAYAFGRLTATF